MTQSVSGLVTNSNRTVVVVTKQQERLHALDLSILKIQTDQAELSSTLQTEQTTFLTKLGKIQQARAMSPCKSLLDTIHDTIPTTAAEQIHRVHLSSSKRMTAGGLPRHCCSRPSSPRSFHISRRWSLYRSREFVWRLESCPRSADVTTATRQALGQA